jgi:hypothetical protein
MDELMNLITEKTGIPPDVAKPVAEVVIGFLKQKLPAPVGSQIDNVLGMQVPSGTASQGQKGSGGLGQMLGGMFGKKEQ